MSTPTSDDNNVSTTDAADDAANRVRRHLTASTDHIDLVATPIGRVKDRAGQRAARRQRMVAGGLIAAASVGVVGGVAMLTRSEPSRVITSSDAEGATPTDSGVEQAPTPAGPDTDPTTTVVSGVNGAPGPVATVPFGSESGADLFGELGMATETDPAFVWKVVDPGKEASISSAFGGQFDSTFPAFALSTAPGRSNDYDNIQTYLYRSDDGINWTQTPAQTPFSSGYWNAIVSGEQVFVTGTAPGVARTEPNPLQIAVGDGDAWDIAELPIDTNSNSSLPMVQFNGPNASSLPYGDGALVVVSEQAYPDFSLLDDGPDGMTVIDPHPDGPVFVRSSCLEEQSGSYDPTLDLFGPDGEADTVPTTSIFDTLEDGDDYFGCPVTKMTWSELGLPQESIDALANPVTRFFVVSPALDITEIDGPGDGVYYTTGGTEPIVELAVNCCSDAAPPRYELVDGAWVELPSTLGTALARQGVPLQELNGERVGLFGTQSDGRVPFMTIGPDGTQRGVDLQSLLATDAPASSSWSEYAGTTGSYWVGAVQTYDDPIARSGGVEVEFGDVVVVQAQQNERFELLDAATREPIDRSLVSGDDNGIIEVRNEAGEVRAEFSIETVYNAVMPEVDQQVVPTHSILTTADGTSFSVESVATLLGLADADISRVARVGSNGNSMIVTVTLTERYADDTRKQLVLVGTPIG